MLILVAEHANMFLFTSCASLKNNLLDFVQEVQQPLPSKYDTQLQAPKGMQPVRKGNTPAVAQAGNSRRRENRAPLLQFARASETPGDCGSRSAAAEARS